MLTAILISGAPGVGKTDTGRLLVRRLPERSAVIDTDSLAPIKPFVVDSEFETLVEKNLDALFANLVEWGARTIVISGVARSGALLDVIKNCCRRYNAALDLFVLWASPEIIDSRIAADAKIQDPEGRRAWMYLNSELPELPHATVIDTSNQSIHEV